MDQKPITTAPLWEARMRRARDLRSQAPSDEIWRLYVPILDFQSRLAQQTRTKYQHDLDLRCQIDFDLLATALDPLLEIVLSTGPDLLQREAQHLQTSTHEDRVRGFRSYAEGAGSRGCGTDDFFFRACLQPPAENLQVQIPTDRNQAQNRCPVCGEVPQLAFLRSVGEGSANWLQCSFCLREWEFRRLVCVWCGEENKEKLPRYSPEEKNCVQLFACDTCKRYLKAIDMTIDGNLVPLVDEVASAVLDVWAAKHDYAKMVQNLMGL